MAEKYKFFCESSNREGIFTSGRLAPLPPLKGGEGKSPLGDLGAKPSGGQGGYIAPSFFPTFVNFSIANRICSSLCAALSCTRILDLPLGTIG